MSSMELKPLSDSVTLEAESTEDTRPSGAISIPSWIPGEILELILVEAALSNRSLALWMCHTNRRLKLCIESHLYHTLTLTPTPPALPRLGSAAPQCSRASAAAGDQRDPNANANPIPWPHIKSILLPLHTRPRGFFRMHTRALVVNYGVPADDAHLALDQCGGRLVRVELTTRASMLDSNISFSGVSSAGQRRRHGRAQLGEVADEAEAEVEAARMLVALLALLRLSPASALDTSTYLRITGGSASMGEAGAFGCLVELFVGCGSLEDEGFWMNPGLRDAMPCLRRVGARVSQWVAPGIGGGVFDFSLPPPPPPPSPSPPRFSEAATASSVGGGKPADSALRSTGPSGAQCQWGVARVLECLPSGLECFVVFPNPLIEIEPFLVPAGHSPRPGSYSLHPPLTPASAQNQISDIISGYSYPKVVFGVSKKQYEGVVDPELLEQLGDPEEIVSSICVDGVGCSWQYKGTAAGDSLREMRDEMWRQAKNIIKRRVTKNTKGVCL